VCVCVCVCVSLSLTRLDSVIHTGFYGVENTSGGCITHWNTGIGIWIHDTSLTSSPDGNEGCRFFS
jgi:hypothetical protein